MTEPSLTGHHGVVQDQTLLSLPRQGDRCHGGLGGSEGRVGISPPSPVTSRLPESPRNVLTHLSAFARAILSAQPVLPYLRPPPLDNVTHILQSSAPGACPLGPLLQYAGTEEPRPSPRCPHVLPHTFPTTAVTANDGNLFRGSCPLPQTVSS